MGLTEVESPPELTRRIIWRVRFVRTSPATPQPRNFTIAGLNRRQSEPASTRFSFCASRELQYPREATLALEGSRGN